MSYNIDNNHRSFSQKFVSLEEKQSEQDMRLVKNPAKFTIFLMTAIMILGYILLSI